VHLLEENLVLGAVPAAGPIFIGPADAKGKIRFTRSQYLIEWALEEPATVEPVVVITKSKDPVVAC
jgi:hypothetical protein